VPADKDLVEQIGRNDMVRGRTISAVGFYGPQGRELRLPLANPDLNRRIEAFCYNGKPVTNYEMESAPLQGLALLLGHRAMTVCSIIANRVSTQATPNYKTAIHDLVATVLDRI
jgi:uridine phosphorylase